VSDAVAVIRRFNRSYTQRIGALDDSFLGMGMPLGPARLLFEIGTAPGTTQALRERLGLDSGYLSRLLRRLERDGLVRVVPDRADRRRRQVSLTEAGRERWQELERRSDDRARLIVDPLTERQRDRLARALREADLLVRAATVRFDAVDPAGAVARDVVGRYFAEIGRRFGFEASGETEKDALLLVPPAGVFVVAVSDGEPVACGGVQTIAPATGEIKRMWVHDDWRGAGLGSRLLRHLEDQARALGHAAVRLDTNKALTEAIGMYQRAGYAAVGRYNDNPWATHFFEKRLPPSVPALSRSGWESGCARIAAAGRENGPQER
jgi:DNA-binding MarR family transcriptional regulator